MDDVRNTKEVDFATFCRTCKFGPKEEHEEPCDECLTQPWNENSHKPVKYKEAE